MKEETTLDSILKPIAGLVLLVPSVMAILACLWIWSGYVLSIMWGWFVVPTFGLPALSIPAAIGIAMVAGMLCKQHIPQDEDEKWKPFARAFVSPAMTLFAGWIVTKFV